MITAKEWTLKNWDQYDLNLKNKEEMLELLNILDAHDENLDSLHKVLQQEGHLREFCGIIGRMDTDAEIARSLFDFNLFYTEEKYQQFLKESAEDNECTIAEVLESEDIRKTEDGYVRVLYY